MELIESALDRMVFGLSEVEFGTPYSSRDPRRTTQMRFDTSSLSELTITEAAQLLRRDITLDLEDLVVNGTGPGGGDALLSAFVGSVRSGKELTAFEIQSAGIWQEYKPKSKRWEYTLYCVLYAEYDFEPAEVWK